MVLKTTPRSTQSTLREPRSPPPSTWFLCPRLSGFQAGGQSLPEPAKSANASLPLQMLGLSLSSTRVRRVEEGAERSQLEESSQFLEGPQEKHGPAEVCAAVFKAASSTLRGRLGNTS